MSVVYYGRWAMWNKIARENSHEQRLYAVVCHTTNDSWETYIHSDAVMSVLNSANLCVASIHHNPSLQPVTMVVMCRGWKDGPQKWLSPKPWRLEAGRRPFEKSASKYSVNNFLLTAAFGSAAPATKLCFRQKNYVGLPLQVRCSFQVIVS